MKTDVAILAGGCFWGVQQQLRKLDGVVSTEVGSTGGRNDRGPLGKRKLSHAKTVFCTMWYRLCVMSGIFRTPT